MDAPGQLAVCPPGPGPTWDSDPSPGKQGAWSPSPLLQTDPSPKSPEMPPRAPRVGELARGLCRGLGPPRCRGDPPGGRAEAPGPRAQLWERPASGPVCVHGASCFQAIKLWDVSRVLASRAAFLPGASLPRAPGRLPTCPGLWPLLRGKPPSCLSGGRSRGASCLSGRSVQGPGATRQAPGLPRRPACVCVGGSPGAPRPGV